jgi:hypothetical protein
VVPEVVVVFSIAAVKAVTLACLGDEMAEVLGIGGRGEVGVVEAAVIVGLEVGEVLPNEAQIGRTGARLEEQRIGGEEAGAGFGGEAGHAVDGLRCVGDSGEKRRAENAGGDAGFAQAADGVEAQIRAGGAGLEQAGKSGVGCGDGDVDDEAVATVDLLE